MTFTTNHFAKRLSRQTRRAIAALIITGTMVTSSLCFAPAALSSDTHDSVSVLESRQTPPVASAKSDLGEKKPRADYWIFSNDYCGWASAEAFVAPYSINPLATEPVRSKAQRNELTVAANVVDQTLARQTKMPTKTLLETAIAKAIGELAAQEPIDVFGSINVAEPAVAEPAVAEPAAKLIGSSPIVVSISEGYLPYDLSRADQISLRMYPISIPQFRYVGGRRTMNRSTGDYGPLDCLGHGVIWTEEVLPSESVSVASVSSSPSPSTFWTSVKMYARGLRDFAMTVATECTASADLVREKVVFSAVEAVQPNSELRESLQPRRLGAGVASSLTSVHWVASAQVESFAQALALKLPLVAPEKQPALRAEQLEKAVGERLLVRAGIEVDAVDCATAGVADVVRDKVCCPVERDDLAAQMPASHHLATVGVAAATLEMPHEPLVVSDAPIGSGFGGLAHAEALATACDSAAATLERFALALRRAGDSVVRVAKSASAEAGTALR